MEELIEGVRTVARGEAVLAPAVTRSVIEAFTRLPTPREELVRKLDELTAREVEVLELLAAGLSNPEIAGKLVLSDTTVKTHVGHILMKLDLRDRVQAVVFAYESGLARAGHRSIARPRYWKGPGNGAFLQLRHLKLIPGQGYRRGAGPSGTKRPRRAR